MCLHVPLTYVPTPPGSQAWVKTRHLLCVYFSATWYPINGIPWHLVSYHWNPLALVDKCHGLFYVPTETRDGGSKILSKGHESESSSSVNPLLSSIQVLTSRRHASSNIQYSTETALNRSANSPFVWADRAELFVLLKTKRRQNTTV